MAIRARVALAVLAGLAGAAALPAPAAEPSQKGKRADAVPAAKAASEDGGEMIQAQAPPFSEGIFPCTQCHQKPGDPKRRELVFHEEIQQSFHHDSENRWCLDCHSNANRDMLHLSGGALVPFTESYRLCGQCHGDKYRDWRAGVHGKRVGMWNGKKIYYLCVNCHNPHAPRFKPLKPEPPPVRPQEMKP
jgi:hypothetical protein